MRKFTQEDYNNIKNVLADNNITSKMLDQYLTMKSLRYCRHKEENTLTDEQILEQVNNTKKED